MEPVPLGSHYFYLKEDKYVANGLIISILQSTIRKEYFVRDGL